MKAVKQLFGTIVQAELSAWQAKFMEQLLHMTDVENQEVQADTIRADLIQAAALIKYLF